MNLTVISHSCILPANQRVWAAVAAQEDVQLRLIVPRRWNSSLHGPLTLEVLPELAEAVRPLHAFLSGRLHLHFYSDLGPALTDGLPDVLYLDEDPHSLVASQVLSIQQLMEFRLVITLKQNILKRYFGPFRTIERRAFRKAAAATATSTECLDVARAKGYTGPAEPIYYPIGIAACAAAPEPHDDLVVVGYAGRLTAAKGVVDLIEAAALAQRRQPLRLLIAGEGPQRAELEQLAADHLLPSTWEFMGVLVPEQMPAWYSSLDLLVVPSLTTARWKEQFGRVAAEAMACQVPVIGSSSGFIPELIESTGGGVVYPEGDVEALSAALVRLAQDKDLRGDIGRDGREGVVRQYSNEAVAEKILRLAREVASR